MARYIITANYTFDIGSRDDCYRGHSTYSEPYLGRQTFTGKAYFDWPDCHWYLIKDPTGGQALPHRNEWARLVNRLGSFLFDDLSEAEKYLVLAKKSPFIDEFDPFFSCFDKRELTDMRVEGVADDWRIL